MIETPCPLLSTPLFSSPRKRKRKNKNVNQNQPIAQFESERSARKIQNKLYNSARNSTDTTTDRVPGGRIPPIPRDQNPWYSSISASETPVSSRRRPVLDAPPGSRLFRHPLFLFFSSCLERVPEVCTGMSSIALLWGLRKGPEGVSGTARDRRQPVWLWCCCCCWTLPGVLGGFWWEEEIGVGGIVRGVLLLTLLAVFGPSLGGEVSTNPGGIRDARWGKRLTRLDILALKIPPLRTVRGGEADHSLAGHDKDRTLMLSCSPVGLGLLLSGPAEGLPRSVLSSPRPEDELSWAKSFSSESIRNRLDRF
mmetsp:Transcript_51104/g.100429  ORF Transcript_51104/g.100429 Transcript_51104/m.100429 type:complete len:309 (+) Transcript_51104:1062-1988(+)